MLNSISLSPPAVAIVSRDAVLTAARSGSRRLARRLVWDRDAARDVVQGALLEALDR